MSSLLFLFSRINFSRWCHLRFNGVVYDAERLHGLFSTERRDGNVSIRRARRYWFKFFVRFPLSRVFKLFFLLCAQVCLVFLQSCFAQLCQRKNGHTPPASPSRSCCLQIANSRTHEVEFSSIDELDWISVILSTRRIFNSAVRWLVARTCTPSAMLLFCEHCDVMPEKLTRIRQRSKRFVNIKD